VLPGETCIALPSISMFNMSGLAMSCRSPLGQR